jgi:hypothetical protein
MEMSRLYLNNFCEEGSELFSTGSCLAVAQQHV